MLRDKILESAYKFFVEKGYEKTPITDILLDCGISKGALYHYFASKEQLMNEVIEDLISKDFEKISTVIEDDTICEMDKLYLIFSSAIVSDEKILGSKESIFYHRSMDKSKVRTIEIIVNVISSAIDKNEITVENPLIIAQMIYASMVVVLQDSTKESKEQYGEEFLKLCSGLLGHDFKIDR